MFPLFKPKIAPLSGEELYEFTKKATGLTGDIYSVLASPKATVLSVYDVYSWAKWMYEWYSEDRIFSQIVHSRRYPNEKELLILSSSTRTIKDFIKFILRVEQQSLADEEIDILIERYDAVRGNDFKK